MTPKIAVIGDSFLDITRYHTVRGPSPEAPEAKVLRYQDTELALGGAGNVANWLSLSGKSEVTLYSPWSAFCSLVDSYLELQSAAAIRVGLPYRLYRETHETARKERIVSVENGALTHHCRVDTETLGLLIKPERLYLEAALQNQPYDALVLVDYDKWTFRGEEGDRLVSFLRSYAFGCHKPVFINSKRPERWKEFGATAFLCNLQEAQTLAGYDLEDAVSKIKVDLVLVTLGKDGVHAFQKCNSVTGLRQEFKTRATQVVDVTGAGDAFLAGFVSTSLGNRWWTQRPAIQQELSATAIETGQRWAARCCAQVGVGDPTKRLEWEGKSG